MLRITGLRELAQRLARLRPDEEAATALDGAAATLADAVRGRLSAPPGGAHDAPWLRTGALRDSIGHASDGFTAAVGSASAAAAAQEMGTSRLPPRPFLAPAAAEHGAGLAGRVGAAVVEAVRGAVGGQGAAAQDAPAQGPPGRSTSAGSGDATA